MKKLSITLCACLALSGCMIGFDSDIDSAAATRNSNRADYRSEFGCPLTDDHEAYRQCLLNTYYGSHPKTFKTTIDENGNSVAVIKDETKSSYDENTGHYKTERVIVIETEERLVSAPAIPPVPMPELAPVEPTPVEPVPVAVTQENKVEVKKQPAPATWWDTYQKDKGKSERKLLDKEGCPCADPNDPCPQCYDK